MQFVESIIELFRKIMSELSRRKRAMMMLFEREEAANDDKQGAANDAIEITEGTSEQPNTELDSYVDDCPAKRSNNKEKPKDKPPRENQYQIKCGFEFRLERLNGRLPSHVDLANLLHYCLIGSPVEKPAWTIFKHWKGFLQTVFFRINCNQEYLENSYESFKFINNFFNKDWTKLDHSVAKRDDFWRNITNVRRSLALEIKSKLEGKNDPLLWCLDDNIRLRLMLSLNDMIMLQHPFPNEGLEDPRIRIIQTKQKYRKVTEKSPIFTLDCEMCMTKSGDAELTRISMMNERGEIVLDSLVKPEYEITDYLTIYSGITPEVMKDVDISLADIQKALSLIIPDDAILCGHSLEFDLKALRMSHPYIIDIGNLFDLKGRTRSRTSLKVLANVFLKKDIQDETIGHCSVEDALATFELLQLKIKNGIHFGKICDGWDFQRWNRVENAVPDYCTRYLNCLPGSKPQREEVPKQGFSSTLSYFQAKEECQQPKEREYPKQPVSEHVEPTPPPVPLTEESKDPKELVKATEELVKSTQITSKLCTECGTKIGTNCIATNCRCANATPTICVRCLTKELENELVNQPTPVMNESEEFVEWRDAVTIEQYKSSRITDYLAEYGGKPGNKTILAAFKYPEAHVKPSKICHVVNSSDYASLSAYANAVKPRIMEHRLCLLERGVDSETVPYKELDKIMKDLVGSMSKNCLFLLMLTSPEKSILYAKVKNF